MADPFRQIFEYADFGICMVDDQGTIRAANASLCRLLGYQRTELTQLALADINTENLGRWPELDAPVPTPGERHTLFQREFRHKDGTSVWVQVSSAGLPPDESGNTYHILQIQDASDLVNLKIQFKDAVETARKNETVKQQFLANVSREIRTPLTPILGFYDVIRKELQDVDSPKIDKYLQIIRHNCNRLTHTVDEIVHMAELQGGAILLNKEILDLSTIVDRIFREQQIGAESKDLVLTFNSTVQEGKILADRQTLTFAIGNILDNAIKYTHEGSIRISLDATDETLILGIQDTGVGISSENLHTIREAFIQESEGETRLYSGLGLGLTIAGTYLEMNAATLTFESEKHVGTTVSMSFPLCATIPVESQTPEEIFHESRNEHLERRPLILIVEDDLHAQLLTELHLKDAYDTCFAVSAEEARDQLATKPVDLILMDISLEGEENGLDLTRDLRTQNAYRELPIIALTAHAFASDRRNALAAGCNDYMTKPIVKKQLMQKVQAVLEIKD